ncbi:MAG: glycosyltransferase [Salibacteraceae bacterium]
MPKVLRIINRFNLGGPTFNVAYLSHYLSEPYETLLVGGTKDVSEDTSEFIVEKLGLEPLIIPEMKREIDPRLDWKAYWKLRRLIREYQPDIVHTHASKAGTLGRLAALHEGVPVILHTFHGHVFHSYFSKAKTTFYKTIERYLARKTSGIIAISERQRFELCEEHRICATDKTHIVPLGFDLSRFREAMDQRREAFRQRYGLADDTVAIGIIGRLVPIKNHRLFLEALVGLRQRSSTPFRAFIVGDGELRQDIESWCDALQLPWESPERSNPEALVTLTSWIRDVELVYPGLDIVALTSLNEGTPVSLIEAQAAERPIVSTNVGGIENVVLQNTTALLSPTADVAGFTNHLIQLVDDADLRKKMGLGGWAHVKEKFHYLRLVKDIRTLYDRLLDKA